MTRRRAATVARRLKAIVAAVAEGVAVGWDTTEARRARAILEEEGAAFVAVALQVVVDVGDERCESIVALPPAMLTSAPAPAPRRKRRP